MMKRTILIAGAIAFLAAVFLSVFMREGSMILLCSMVVGLFAVAFALAGCIRSRRPRWHTLSLWLVPAAVFVSISCSHLPLRLVFRLHRAEFDRVATLIEKGTPPAVPFWIGPFRITMVGRRGDSGTPYVATNTEKSEIDGFVRHPEGHGFNLWSWIPLDESWSYIAED
jgi:hypothetical protein